MLLSRGNTALRVNVVKMMTNSDRSSFIDGSTTRRKKDGRNRKSCKKFALKTATMLMSLFSQSFQTILSSSFTIKKVNNLLILSDQFQIGFQEVRSTLTFGCPSSSTKHITSSFLREVHQKMTPDKKSARIANTTLPAKYNKIQKTSTTFTWIFSIMRDQLDRRTKKVCANGKRPLTRSGILIYW